MAYLFAETAASDDELNMLILDQALTCPKCAEIRDFLYFLHHKEAR